MFSAESTNSVKSRPTPILCSMEPSIGRHELESMTVSICRRHAAVKIAAKVRGEVRLKAC
jgi:hypothetical protein